MDLAFLLGHVQNQLLAGRGLSKTACAVTCALKLYHHDVNPFLLRPVYQHSPACPPHVGRIYKPDTSLRIRAWAQKLKNCKFFTVIFVLQTNHKTIICFTWIIIINTIKYIKHIPLSSLKPPRRLVEVELWQIVPHSSSDNLVPIPHCPAWCPKARLAEAECAGRPGLQRDEPELSRCWTPWTSLIYCPQKQLSAVAAGGAW